MILNSNEYWRDRYRQSLYKFMVDFWDVIEPRKLEANWHIEYICGVLQEEGMRVIKGLPKRYDAIVINVSPGETKSRICSVFWPLWFWINDPTIQLICTSHDQTMLNTLGERQKDIIKSKRFREIFSNVQVKKDSDTKSFFETTSGGWRLNPTIGGKATGWHAHVKIIDDPVKVQDVHRPLINKRVVDYYKQTLSSRNVDKKITLTCCIAQRTGNNDLSNYILENEKRVLHIRLPAETGYKISPKYLESFYTKGVMNPLRFDRESINEIKGKVPGSTWSTQYGQSPDDKEGNIIKASYVPIKSFIQLPKDLLYEPTRFYVDTAQTDDPSNDPTGIGAFKRFGNRLYMIGYKSIRAAFSGIISEIKVFIQAYGNSDSLIIIEPKNNGKDIIDYLVTHEGLNAYEYDMPKEARQLD